MGNKQKMPSVGILSMQRVINYGSFLQAYALRALLKEAGAGEVSFVDIIPGRRLLPILSDESLYRKVLRKLRLALTPKYFLTFYGAQRFGRRYAADIVAAWPALELDHPKQREHFDFVVIGSDEVFNCCQATPWGYTRQLYGHISADVAKKVFSYAGSFGHTTLPELRQYGIDKEIGADMATMQAISVRDANSADIVESLTNERPPIHIDPVLAYGYKREINGFEKSPISKKYLLIYTYNRRLSDKKETRAIKDYATKKGLIIVSVFCWYGWCDRAVSPKSPIDVLQWFKYAEAVITDTFHGTIFSIITHAKFATLVRPSNRNKLSYLLDMVGLANRQYDTSLNLEHILAAPVDYAAVERKLDEQRGATFSYLQENLSVWE